MFENMTKMKVYAILSGIFCFFTLLSDIIATKTININWIVVPCCILTFPIVFIINEILTEIYGFKMTKDVIYLGFILNFISIIVYIIAIELPSNNPKSEAFAIILGYTPRIIIAGFCAYLVGNIVNSLVLVKLKEKYSNSLFVNYFVSTAIAYTLDAIIFISVGFIGTMSTESILIMICCLTIIDIIYGFICYPITKKVILKIKKLDDGELKGQIHD